MTLGLHWPRSRPRRDAPHDDHQDHDHDDEVADHDQVIVVPPRPRLPAAARGLRDVAAGIAGRNGGARWTL